ncbi:MAG TPA: M28 family peptidase [Nitrososphaeraceae archaeon]|nr:M28 family peptidase [Nitrososphaeraceae archaeon]
MKEDKPYIHSCKEDRPRVPIVPSEITQAKKAAYVRDKFIDSQIELVSQTRIETWINRLTSSFPTRHSKSRFINQVAEWLKKEFENIGLTNVYFHNYNKSNYQLKNVICNKQGENDKVILICAHYDSRMKDLEDAESSAPGADDNASGVAVVLETALVLLQLDLYYSIQFVLFSGEEQDLWGAEEYAHYVKGNNIDIHRVINLDMVGYPPLGQQIINIEREIGNTGSACNRVSSNDKESETFARTMEEMASVYTNLIAVKGPIYGSDYCPFENRGYVVTGLYDEGQRNNPHYHSSDDLPSDLDTGYITSVTKLIVATILKEARSGSSL